MVPALSLAGQGNEPVNHEDQRALAARYKHIYWHLPELCVGCLHARCRLLSFAHAARAAWESEALPEEALHGVQGQDPVRLVRHDCGSCAALGSDPLQLHSISFYPLFLVTLWSTRLGTSKVAAAKEKFMLSEFDLAAPGLHGLHGLHVHKSEDAARLQLWMGLYREHLPGDLSDIMERFKGRRGWP